MPVSRKSRADAPEYAVIGAGAWGTALACVLGARAGAVALWGRDAAAMAAMRKTRETPRLKGVSLPESVRPGADLEGIARADVILMACPAQAMRAVAGHIRPHIAPATPIVICAKGVERGSLALMSDVLAETLPEARLAVLSGPGFARDIALGRPTALTLAAHERALARRLVRALSAPAFRLYASTDPLGAQMGGAVKNVLAIACGISDGRGLGASARAALIARGFAEMTRLARALGARPRTLAGLSGLGDLVLTCTDAQSRNMSLGLALGRGEALSEVLASRHSVSEGVHSAAAVVALAKRHGVEMPICEVVHNIVAERIGVDAAIGALLARPLKTEGA